MGSHGRGRGDGGAVAILVSLVLLFAVFPLLALGYTTYVRGATGAELSRSADSGSLAGAASIPLGDLSFAVASANAATGVPLPAGAPDPLALACEQASAAAAADDGFARTFTVPAPSASQLSSSFDCTARYLSDLDFLDRFGRCANNLLAGLPVDAALSPLLTGLKHLLPALLRPGVAVELDWDVRGPLDALNPADSGDPSEQEVVARARRRFKNLVVIPTTTPPGASEPIPLNGAVRFTGDQAIAAIEALDANPTVQSLLASNGCTGLFRAFVDDYRDVINPPPDADAPSPEEEIQRAADDNAPLLALVVPADPTAFLGIPFLDFVPVCVAVGGSELLGYPEQLGPVGQCVQNAPGAFRAVLVEP
jgi:hypothetical protein